MIELELVKCWSEAEDAGKSHQKRLLRVLVNIKMIEILRRRDEY